MMIPSRRADVFSVEGETTIVVNGVSINYVQAGTGDHVVFCLPGALGSIWTHLKPQILGLDKSEFTVIAWDPPGYGNSRGTTRKFPTDFLQRDADYALQLMSLLNFKRYSLLGWCNGGVTALIMAAKCPERIRKLVVWGTNAYLREEDVQAFETLRDINNKSANVRVPLVDLYGNDYLTDMWNLWLDAIIKIYEQGGNLCREALPKIRCPTLLVHGMKDPLISSKHPNFLMNNIKNARLFLFQDGKHNLHLRYATEFNNLVHNFLLQNN